MFFTVPYFTYSLREKCPYSECFWSVFSRIRTEYGEIRSISFYSVWMRENTDQENSEYRNFSRTELLILIWKLVIVSLAITLLQFSGRKWQLYHKFYLMALSKKIWFWGVTYIIWSSRCSGEIYFASRPNPFKDFRGGLPQILLGPFLQQQQVLTSKRTNQCSKPYGKDSVVAQF